MFGFIEGVFDSVVDTVDEFVEDPIGKTTDMVLQPVVDAADVLDGLSEGEIRTQAALRLGTDVVAGMALSEILEVLQD